MDRKPLHDILTPSDQRSRTRKSRPTPEASGPQSNARTSRKRGFGNWKLFGAGLVVIVLFGLFLTLFFGGAKVSVFPKQASAVVNGTFFASREAQTGELAYQTITLERTLSKEIEATGEESAEERASGTIVVYNSYSSTSQKLIKNTRFQTPEGLVYRVRESIVVPGFTKKGSEIIPGSLEITVYADEPGDKYNIGLSDFKLPGFKDSKLNEQYEAFFARSKTPMTGGFVGTRKKVSETDLADAKSELQSSLVEELNAAVQSEKPENYLAYDDGLFFTFETTQEDAGGDKVRVQEKATLHGLLFEKEDFAGYLAESVLATYDGGAIVLQNPEALTVELIDDAGTQPWTADRVSLNISGEAAFVWEYDETQLKSDLAGKEKAALPTILSGYPSIERAEAVVRPFWASSFPDSPQDITITRILD